MKYLANEHAARGADPFDLSSEVTFYTRTKDGQYEMWPRPSKFRKWIFPVVGLILVIGFLIA